VWKLTDHRTLRVRATGVEKVLGLAFRGDKLYALEMSTSAGGPTRAPGRSCALGGTVPQRRSSRTGPSPTGMTVGPDGAFYVSNQGFGFGEGQGQIPRIKP
jgi:hypothetical protein